MMSISDEFINTNNWIIGNLNNYCRLCANYNIQDSDLFQVFECKFSLDSNENVDIPNFLNLYLNVAIHKDDEFPKSICRNCLQILIEFINYKKKCQESQDKLLEIMKKQKEEIQSNEIIFEEITTNINEDQENDQLNHNYIEENESSLIKEKDTLDVNYSDKNHVCLDCGENFTKKVSLKLHRKTCDLIGSDNSKQKGPFRCDQCLKILPTWVGYRVHKTMHLRQENGIKRKCKKKEEPLIKKDDLNVCYVCGKTFKQGGALKLHLLFHSKTKNFECDICKKRYYTKSSLKDHLNIHSNEKKFDCTTCGKSFFTNRHLRKHIIIHRTDLRKISCTMCSKKFIHPYQMQMHMMVHTGDKPFNCTDCEAKFRFSWELRKHAEKNHKVENEIIEKEVHPIAIEVHLPKGKNDDSEIYYEYL